VFFGISIAEDVPGVVVNGSRDSKTVEYYRHSWKPSQICPRSSMKLTSGEKHNFQSSDYFPPQVLDYQILN
jgi:hypothetical protein